MSIGFGWNYVPVWIRFAGHTADSRPALAIGNDGHVIPSESVSPRKHTGGPNQSFFVYGDSLTVPPRRVAISLKRLHLFEEAVKGC